jgi:hypothetical protein
MVRGRRCCNRGWWCLHLRLLSTYFESWGETGGHKRMQAVGAVHGPQILPTIATHPHTSRWSTTRESMGDVPCPDTPPIIRRHWRSPLKPPKLEVTSGPAALQEDSPTHRGRRKPLDKLPPSSGLWPVRPILGFRVPSELPIVCLSLTINRASENVTKPPEHPQQRRKPGENS